MPQPHTRYPSPWLVAYDIGDPRRLARIGRLARKHAFRIQRSLYLHTSGDAAFDDFWSQLAAEIDPAADDVRAWRLTTHCHVWSHGRTPLPPDVHLSTSALVEKIIHGEVLPWEYADPLDISFATA